MGDLCSGSFFPPTIISIFKSFQIHSTSTEGKHDRYKNIPIVIFHCVNILHLVYPLISWWTIEFSYLLDVLNNADVNTQLQVFGCMLSILHLVNVWVSQMALVVKNPPANTGDIRDMSSSLDQEDPVEEGMATHFSILAWRITRTEEPGRLQSIESRRVRHDWSDLAPMNTVILWHG